MNQASVHPVGRRPRPTDRTVRSIPLHAGSRGFTLIEMMIVLLIAGILASAALPSFVGLAARARVQAKASGLVGDLSLARSESVRRAGVVVVCPSSDGATCRADGNWNAGRIVFVDLDDSGTADGGGETVLRTVGKSAPDSITITPGVGLVRFVADGTAGTRVVYTVCSAGQPPYVVTLSAIGRATLSKGTASC